MLQISVGVGSTFLCKSYCDLCLGLSVKNGSREDKQAVHRLSTVSVFWRDVSTQNIVLLSLCYVFLYV